MSRAPVRVSPAVAKFTLFAALALVSIADAQPAAVSIFDDPDYAGLSSADRFAGFTPRLGTWQDTDRPEWWNFDNSNRAEAQDVFYTIFTPAVEQTAWEDFQFTALPNLTTGDGGMTPFAYRDAMLRWVNLNRYVSSDVAATFAHHDDTHLAASQAAALLMVRNRRYSHTPTPDWEGYNELAAQGAVGMIGGTGVIGIEGLLADGTDINFAVGHRQQVLSRAVHFAPGAVVSEGLAVTGGFLRAGETGVVRLTGWDAPEAVNPRRGDPVDYVSVYPARGFVADGIIGYYSSAYIRASLEFQHAATVDFRNATVEVWRNGEPVEAIVRYAEYPSNRIAFDLPGGEGQNGYMPPKPLLADMHFRVRVSGVRFSSINLGGVSIFQDEYAGYVPPAGIYDTPRTVEWEFTVFDERVVAPANYVSQSPVANLSTRAKIGKGSDVLIGGFVIEGAEPMRVVIRGMGPFLADYGVRDAAENPTVTLYRAINGASDLVGRVADWKDQGSWRMVESYGLAPTNDNEVAVVATLPPGAYTAVVEDAGKGGIGIIEVYAADTFSRSRLANVSTRGVVGNGPADMMIGGVVLNQTRTLVIRARGPELTAYGIEGALADPKIEVYRGTEKIYENADWDTPENTALKNHLKDYRPVVDKEPACVLTLSPGAYTVLVTGEEGGSGVALVEIYDVTDEN